eukprot:tig00000842_g4839.t1
MTRLEGTCFGYPLTGALDGPLALLKRLISRGGPTAVERILDSGLWPLLCRELKALGPASEISPSGLLTAVKTVYDVVSRPIPGAVQLLLRDDLLRSLVALLREARLRRILQWRTSAHGRGAAVQLLQQAVSVLYVPLANAVEEQLFATVQQEMYAQQLVQHLVAALPLIPVEYADLPVGLLSRLVLGGNQFAVQFSQAGGISGRILGPLLDTARSPSLIVDTLLIISQLARISKEHYEPIHKAELYQAFGRLLNHSDPGVRAKVCNLLGNLCRHSAFFYDALLRHNLLSDLIERCQDPDRSTRKFASFAIGNAGFHNDSLYDALRPCIPALVILLKDSEEKTRANAAGALGNLVRNSSALTMDPQRKSPSFLWETSVLTMNAVISSWRMASGK